MTLGRVVYFYPTALIAKELKFGWGSFEGQQGLLSHGWSSLVAGDQGSYLPNGQLLSLFS